jgi:ubiquinone/menaquinone biosynthesis C-methylase UbiE
MPRETGAKNSIQRFERENNAQSHALKLLASHHDRLSAFDGTFEGVQPMRMRLQTHPNIDCPWPAPATAPATESGIANFWQRNPCGENVLGRRPDGDYEDFFRQFDSMRYTREKHILPCLDAIDFCDKQVLEIGLGQGADAEQIIRRGAHWSGIDLTSESVKRVRTRLKLRKLPYNRVEQGSALNMPFADNSFDTVFSHGVLHHIPDIDQAQREIHRVLRPDGELIVMLYAKRSLNYLLSIGVARRLALVFLYGLNYAPNAIAAAHIENARQAGLLNYLRMENFIHRNTDGPDNVLSRVYDLPRVRQHFPQFVVTKSYRRFMHAPPLPVSWLPLERLLGWHLWVHLKPIP